MLRVGQASRVVVASLGGASEVLLRVGEKAVICPGTGNMRTKARCLIAASDLSVADAGWCCSTNADAQSPPSRSYRRVPSEAHRALAWTCFHDWSLNQVNKARRPPTNGGVIPHWAMKRIDRPFPHASRYRRAGRAMQPSYLARFRGIPVPH